jgi:hypothetical protein
MGVLSVRDKLKSNGSSENGSRSSNFEEWTAPKSLVLLALTGEILSGSGGSGDEECIIWVLHDLGVTQRFKKAFFLSFPSIKCGLLLTFDGDSLKGLRVSLLMRVLFGGIGVVGRNFIDFGAEKKSIGLAGVFLKGECSENSKVEAPGDCISYGVKLPFALSLTGVSGVAEVVIDAFDFFDKSPVLLNAAGRGLTSLWFGVSIVEIMFVLVLFDLCRDVGALNGTANPSCVVSAYASLLSFSEISCWLGFVMVIKSEKKCLWPGYSKQYFGYLAAFKEAQELSFRLFRRGSFAWTQSFFV